MSEKLILNARGTITLPSKFRRQLGLKTGDVLEIEEKDGLLVLRPTVSLPIEIYSDEQVNAYVAADALSPEQEARFDAWKKKAGL